MGYMRKRWWCANGCQVKEYHTRKSHPRGMKRAGRKNPTGERKQEANQRAKAMKAQRLLLNNFSAGDPYITLTYADGQAPEDLAGCRKNLKALLEWLRPQYREAGIELKWIRNVEKTRRGIYHIHMVVNSLPGRDIGQVIRKWWKGRHGSIARVQAMYLDGGFSRLAEYLSKTQRDDSGNRQSSYSHSRNLADPVPETKKYSRWNVMSGGEWREVRVPKGYELVKESVYEGMDWMTGFPYRQYTLIRAGT